MKRTFLFVLVMMVCACIVSAQGGPPAGRPVNPGGPGGPGGAYGMRGPMMTCPAMTVAPPQATMIERGGEALALTEEQKTKLRAVLTKSEEELKVLRPKIDLANKALRDAIFAPTFDASKVAQLLSDAQKIESSIATSEIQTWGEIRTILTADQAAKLAETMNRRIGNLGGVNARTGGNRNNGNRGNNPPPGGPPPAPAPAPAN